LLRFELFPEEFATQSVKNDQQVIQNLAPLETEENVDRDILDIWEGWDGGIQEYPAGNLKFPQRKAGDEAS
jgi:hypothetical protein